MAAKFIK